MYQTKKFRLAVLCFALLFSMMLAGSVCVHAGISPSTICDETSYEGTELRNDIWFVDSDGSSGATAQNGEILFTAQKTDSRFNLKRKIYNLGKSGIENSFTMEGSFTLNALPAGVRFGFMFGLQSVLGTAGQQGSSMLWFENADGAVQYGLSNFTVDGETSLLTGKTDAGISLGQPFTIDLCVKNNADAILKIGAADEQTIKGVATEGYVGFGQYTQTEEAFSSAKIAALAINGYENETPENAEYFEKFDYESFNMRMFVSSSKAGVLPQSGLNVENGMLHFRNTGEAVFGSLYTYSNVELSFDIPSVQRDAVYENGQLMSSISAPIGISLGAANNMTASVDVPVYVEFRSDGGTPLERGCGTRLLLSSHKNILADVKLPACYDLYNMADTEVLSVRIIVKDCTVVVGLKTAAQTGFTDLITAELENTPTGYFQLMSATAMNSANAGGLAPGSVWQGNFCIDNLSVVNRDSDKVVVAIDYLSNRDPIPEDYEYTDTWDPDDMLSPNA